MIFTRIQAILLSCIVVLTCNHPGVFAQHNDISFKHLSTVEGLSNFTVLGIAQDHQGFMWFGTMDGLNRFDGQNIKVYREDPEDPHALGCSYVWSLLCTGDSVMWVGSNNGLYYYDHQHDDFHHVQLADDAGRQVNNVSIRSLLACGDTLWIGTDHGVFRYDIDNARIIPFRMDRTTGDKPVGGVIALKQSEDGIIWIGDSRGLLSYRNDTFSRIPLLNASGEEVAYQGLGIEFDNSGKLWLGTDNAEMGLIIYNPESQTQSILSAQEGYLPHNRVKSLFRFQDGDFLLGTRWGLALINESTYEYRHYVHDQYDPGSISQNSMRQIFQSQNGIIWIGTYSGGVNFFDPNSQKISHFTEKLNDDNSLSLNIVSYLYEGQDNKIWIGTEYGGLNVFDPAERSFRIFTHNPDKNSLINDNVKNILQDRYGRLFIATQFGLSIYDPVAGSFNNISDVPGSNGYIGHRIVHGLSMDAEGNIWIGTAGKPGKNYLHMYDVARDTIFHYIPDNRNFPSLEMIEIHTMIFDAGQNIIWAGGTNGLTGFDLNTRRYLTDSSFFPTAQVLQNTFINDLILDDKGMVWIATFGRGIYLMESGSKRLRKIDIKEETLGSSFYALTGDANGNIWASSNVHLLKIEPPDHIYGTVSNIEKFDVQEGFPAQQYFKNAASRGSDGTLYFGGDFGFIAFDPEEVENRIIHPRVAVLDILVSGRPVEFPSEEEHFIHMPSRDRVSLSYKQSSFSIQFIAPNYINPENTWYQYILSGIDDVWQDLGNSNAIHFTKLKPGDYELRLRASSDPDSFIEEYTAIFIRIAPPFWRSGVAYFVYLLVIAGLLYLFFLITRQWEGLRQNLRFENLQREHEKEYNQRRLKFFTDISHELRTPLTLILAPLERIVQSNFGSAKIRNQLMLMLRNGDRMMQLINQLLDIRRLETGNIQIQAAKGNIAGFITEVSLSFREIALRRNIEFRVECPGDGIVVWFDRNKFEIILFNLLSNALKYTPDGGRITIAAEDDQDEGIILIKVENTGKGIPEEHLRNIFDRFYSGDALDDPKGLSSGMGLEIAKNMVNLHHGKISAESVYDMNGVDGYACFTILLKVGRDHFSDREIITGFRSSEDITRYTREKLAMITETPEKEVDPAGPPKEESILIVEDNPEIRHLVADVFSDHYNIYTAADGKEGLGIARQEMPDLVISDIIMPGIDGIELCRTLKSDVNTSHIPVILLTARTALTFKYEGLETGADDYIVKPFSIQDLLIRSRNLVKQRKLLKDRFGQSGFRLPEEISLTSVDEKFLQRTVDYISEHIGDHSLTVDRIATEVGMSRANFYRKIKAMTNSSAAEFLRRIRMEHAAQFLKTNKVRISEVPAMVGLSDADYFRECFKEQFGMTPKEFIQSHT